MHLLWLANKKKNVGIWEIMWQRKPEKKVLAKARV
jgi:hypothetical protein